MIEALSDFDDELPRRTMRQEAVRFDVCRFDALRAFSERVVAHLERVAQDDPQEAYEPPRLTYTRGVRCVTYFGETRPIAEWARILGLRAETLHQRIATLPLEAAFDARLISNAVKRTTVSKELYVGAALTAFEDDYVIQQMVDEFGRLNMSECAFILGVSRERVRQIEEDACNKLRKSVHGRRLLTLLREASE